MSQDEHDALGVIWNYLKLDQPLKQADVMLVFGSLQTQPAEYAAELYHQGLAPLIIMAGGFGHITKEHNDRPEAEIFAEIAIHDGVPAEAILIEVRSTNTGENIVMARELLDEKGINPKHILLVHKKYDERRTLATFHKLWPDMPATITAPPLTLDEWLATPLKARTHTEVLVGIMHRIIVYPDKGFIVPQMIPTDVLNAFHYLVDKGYTSSLVTD